MILNEAPAVYLGSDGVEAIYLGSEKVWPSGGEYTPIDWIGANGTQYIDTGYTPQSSSTKVEIYANVIGGGAYKRLISCGSFGIGTYWSSVAYLYGLEIYLSYGQTFARIGEFSPSQDEPIFLITAQLSPSGSSMSAKGQSTTASGADASAGASSYCIFADASGGSAQYFISAKVASCKIYDNGTLVRDLVPMIRNFDSKPGLLDNVTQQFYTNAGTGEFDVPT